MVRLFCLAIGYLCGLFQTSYIIGRMHHTDIRKHGSGNAGTTNALRTFGKKAGALTLLGDLMKCVVAILITKILFKKDYAEILPLLSLYAAAGCILGHNFPFYLNFKGGKGIAASVGLVLAFDIKVFAICFIVFATIFFTTHYVSMGSIFAYLTALIMVIIFGQMGSYGMDAPHTQELYRVMAALTILAIYRHRANISRLLKGTENKIFLGKSGKKE